MLQAHWTDYVHDAIRSAPELAAQHVCYIALKGSRLFRVNEPNADVDLRAIFLADTTKMLSINEPQHTIERMHDTKRPDEVDCHDAPDHEKIDFVAYEMRRFFGHLLGNNGNMIESLLVPEGFYWADEHGRALRATAHKLLTKKLFKFYRGYAFGQFKRASQQVKTGKGVIATYREMYMGLHLFNRRYYEFDWHTLKTAVESDLNWQSLVLPKVFYDRRSLTDGLLAQMQEEFTFLDNALQQAKDLSTLPEQWDGYDRLNRMLLKWRSAGWQ